MLTVEYIAVKRRVAINQRALERRDGLDEIVESYRLRRFRKGLRERHAIGGLSREQIAHARLPAGQAQLNRVLIQQRLEHLRFKRLQLRPGPAVTDVVGNIDRQHRAVTQRLTGRTY